MAFAPTGPHSLLRAMRNVHISSFSGLLQPQCARSVSTVARPSAPVRLDHVGPFARPQAPSSLVTRSQPSVLGSMARLTTLLSPLRIAPHPLSLAFSRRNMRTSASQSSSVAASATAHSNDTTAETRSSDSSTTSEKRIKLTRPVVAAHLFLLAALVYAIVVVGGLTRLTESGLSITEWNPGFKGVWLPTTDEEWESEWAKYKLTPEFMLLNQHMDVNDFKSIYRWEWGHRVLGRVIGVAFLLPAVFFVTRGWVAPGTRWKLLAIAGGIGFQGFLGWFMVQSGLAAPERTAPVIASSHPNSTSSAGTEERVDATGQPSDPENPATRQPAEWTPRVSHFRLAAHLGTAFLVYAGMLHTGLLVRRDWKLALRRGKVGGLSMSTPGAAEQLSQALSHPLVRRYAGWTVGLTALVFTTAMSGALVAGLDAGLVYNEFPTMGDGRIAPPLEELVEDKYARRADGKDKVWRNMIENPVTVQLVHRTLAVTTLVSVLALGLRTRSLARALPRATGGRVHLPPAIPRLAALASAFAVGQASLGIATLIYLVPIPLASAHQAGSLALLSAMIALLAALKRPGAAVQLWRERATKRALDKIAPINASATARRASKVPLPTSATAV